MVCKLFLEFGQTVAPVILVDAVLCFRLIALMDQHRQWRLDRNSKRAYFLPSHGARHCAGQRSSTMFQCLEELEQGLREALISLIRLPR